TAEAAAALSELRSARLDGAAQRCLDAVARGEDPAPARLRLGQGVEGPCLQLDPLWDPDVAAAFAALPGTGDGGRTLPVDPWVIGPLDPFLAAQRVAVDAALHSVLADLRAEHAPAPRAALAPRRPRALVVDESHSCKNPQARRSQAVRRLAAAVHPEGLRLALTGTPVLNHAEELISQLRVLGRLEDFGSGARF